MKNKVNAFTLFELVLGMLLSAIVIGMVYNAWFIISKVADGYVKAGKRQSELLVFKKALSADVAKAAEIRYAAGAIIILDTLGGENGLSYEVQDSLLIRKSSQQDTFRLKRLNIQTLFDGKEKSEGLIDQIKLSFYEQKEQLRISVHKSYSSEQLVKTTL